MSIYSGFAKRQQETLYDRVVYKAIDIMATFIYETKFGNPVAIDLKFTKKILKLYKTLNYLEK